MHPGPALFAIELRTTTWQAGLAIVLILVFGRFASERIAELGAGTQADEVVAFVEEVLEDYETAEVRGPDVWAAVLARRPSGTAREWAEWWGPGREWAEFFELSVEEGWEEHWSFSATGTTSDDGPGWTVRVHREGALPDYRIHVLDTADGYFFRHLTRSDPR